MVNSDNKKKARLNCISHVLSKIPYEKIDHEPIELPPLPDNKAYIRPPITYQTFVPEKF